MHWVPETHRFERTLTHTHTHLSGEDAAHSDNAKDVEDGRANNGPYPHVSVGDEDTCTQEGSLSGSLVTLTMCVCVCVCLPMTEAKSSGAELPAAMKVAPATSSLRCSFCMKRAHMVM